MYNEQSQDHADENLSPRSCDRRRWRCLLGNAETQSPAVETIRTIPVRTATVQTRDLVETLSLTGTLNPRSEVTVVPEIAARLERVLKTEGDRVGRGELLAVLDDADFRLSRDRAKAHLDVARGQPRTRASRAGSRRQPGEDRRHHRQGSSCGQGRGAGRRCVGVPGEERARDYRAADGTHAHNGTDQRPNLEASCRRREPLSPPERPLYTIVDDSVFEFRSSVASGDFGKVKVGETVDRHGGRAARLFRPGPSQPHRSAGGRAKPVVRNHHPGAWQA